MQQFVVQKVNRMGEESWTTRVLTIDTNHHVLYLSQRGNVNNIVHHCMVNIKEVNWWPHYSGFWHSTAFFLGDSPLTFCIEGSTLNAGATSPLSRLFHPRTRRITAEEQASLQMSYTTMEQGHMFTAATTPGEVFCADEWMLRCMSRDDIEPLLAALRGAVTDPCRVKGTIHAPSSTSEGEEPTREMECAGRAAAMQHGY